MQNSPDTKMIYRPWSSSSITVNPRRYPNWRTEVHRNSMTLVAKPRAQYRHSTSTWMWMHRCRSAVSTWNNSTRRTTSGNTCRWARALMAASRISSTTASYMISLTRVFREIASPVARKQTRSVIIRNRPSVVGNMVPAWAASPRRDVSAIPAGLVPDVWHQRSRPPSSPRATLSTRCPSSRTSTPLRCNWDSAPERFMANCSEWAISTTENTPF